MEHEEETTMREQYPQTKCSNTTYLYFEEAQSMRIETRYVPLHDFENPQAPIMQTFVCPNSLEVWFSLQNRLESDPLMFCLSLQ